MRRACDNERRSPSGGLMLGRLGESPIMGNRGLQINRTKWPVYYLDRFLSASRSDKYDTGRQLLAASAEEQSIVTSSVSASSAKAVSVHENIAAQAMIADIAADKNFFIFFFLSNSYKI